MPREIFTLRSRFAVEVLDADGRCSGCGKSYKAGASAYVKRWRNMGKPVRTVLCNLEGCWQEWDAAIFTSAYPDERTAREFDMSELYDQDRRSIYK